MMAQPRPEAQAKTTDGPRQDARMSAENVRPMSEPDCCLLNLVLPIPMATLTLTTRLYVAVLLVRLLPG